MEEILSSGTMSAAEVLANRALPCARLLRLGRDAGNLALELLLLEKQHRQKTLKPLQRIVLSLELSLCQLDPCH